MYYVKLGPVVYSKRTGQPFTPVEAMREVYCVGHASVLRGDGSVAVANAGSSTQVIRAPSGRRVRVTRTR